VGREGTGSVSAREFKVARCCSALIAASRFVVGSVDWVGGRMDAPEETPKGGSVNWDGDGPSWAGDGEGLRLMRGPSALVGDRGIVRFSDGDPERDSEGSGTSKCVVGIAVG
jgi:hypothetical protein